MSNPTYVDNAVPYGSRVEAVKRGGGAGSAVGSYVFENITLQRPGKVTERPNEIGAPNGWVLVGGFPTGTAVLQVPQSNSPVPHLGDWFSDTFDGSTGGVAEQWVIVDLGQVFEMQGYYKCNVSLRFSPNPPTA